MYSTTTEEKLEGSALKSNSSRTVFSHLDSDDLAIYTCGRTLDRSDLEPRVILYNSEEVDTSSTATCEIATTYVESEVRCTGSSCRVARLRRSQKPHPPPAWTYLDGDGCIIWRFFSGDFLYAMSPKTSSDLPTMTQGYIKKPDDPSLGQSYEKPMADIGKEAFEVCFAQLLNTFWLTNIGFTTITGGEDLDSMWLKPEDNNKVPTLTSPNTSPVNFTKHGHTTMQTHRLVDVVQCHTGWLFALLLTSAVLMLASVMPTGVRIFARGPRFELSVSTVVRDNPYVDVPAGGSALDSARRSRLLKDLKVKLGDVCPEKGTGHLAVASIDGERAVDDVRRDRIYD